MKRNSSVSDRALCELSLTFAQSGQLWFVALSRLRPCFRSLGLRRPMKAASFWLPGIYGSLRPAVPQAAPGWSLFTFNYYTNVSAGAAVSAAREVEIGRLPPTTATANLSASLNAQADLQWINPSYAFATPVLGGQLTLGMATFVGWQSANLSGTVNITAPPAPFTRCSDSINSSVTGFGDLYPQATLRWNNGVNNFMIYGTGDIPVGAYESSTRLANLGIGHGAADGGAGYTYLNPAKGQEFSAVAGLTYNLENLSTNYQNGVDFHLDWAASQFLSKQVFIGPVGSSLRPDCRATALRRPPLGFQNPAADHR